MTSKGPFSQLLSLIRGTPQERTDTHKRQPFTGSTQYWEKRYARGGLSGAGSYGELAEFKADTINAFVSEHGVQTVLEFGCGDGNQLMLANYPKYLGLDVSETAISACEKRFELDVSKRFGLLGTYSGEIADLALSLDVIYHLVEDQVFQSHMRTLFSAASRFVIIYSSNADHIDGEKASPHVRHRKFTSWVEEYAPEWKILRHLPNRYPFRGNTRTGSFADFYFFDKR